MNIVTSNFIFNSNHCDANRVYVIFRESADQHGCRAKGVTLSDLERRSDRRPTLSLLLVFSGVRTSVCLCPYVCLSVCAHLRKI